ncbi:MAG: rhodanese-like domain-containing protein [Desulfuromonadales bacterium]|nr:rhodanese-like domain-containing protein [Desulfuromonadales bacterium]
MKQIQTLTLLLILLIISSGMTLAARQDEPAVKISGVIVDGLRLLTIGEKESDNHFVIYRGDYIQPSLATKRSFEMVIPALNERKLFPAAEGTNPYIKMKKPGIYPFSAGTSRGTIEVIEYSATHYNELSAAEADKFMKNVQPLLLDVRTPGEFQSGHIKGAVLIPVQQLQKQLAALTPHKEREILIYCATGNRSTVAARILIENGFEKISNIRYGIVDWAERKFPIE